MSQKRVFVVDDHPLVREWLANLINQQGDLVVCGEAEDAPHARTGIESTKPDVAIVDISLGGGSGLELIKDLKETHPELPVIVLSMHDESLYVERALRAGARGYIMKRETAKRVIAAVRQVLDGKLYLSERASTMITNKFAGTRATSGASPVATLSDRELEVFQRLGQGRETKQIAEELHISVKTVQAYCARIKDKLHLTNATELLREAIRWEERPNGV